jgi:hypothetical protein
LDAAERRRRCGGAIVDGNDVESRFAQGPGVTPGTASELEDADFRRASQVLDEANGQRVSSHPTIFEKGRNLAW